VIISTERGKRPNDFLRESVIPREEKIAPSAWAMNRELRRKFSFMAGTVEAQTRRAGASRVVPNKFPALGIEGELDREGEGSL